MHVKIHRLFELLLQTTHYDLEAALGFSLAAPPKLGDYIADLDPELPLDWSGQSFLGWPALRENVLRTLGMEAASLEQVMIAAGAAEANFLAMVQLVQPGDELIADVPGWPQPLVLAEAIGATLKPLRRYEALDWQFDWAELEGLLTPRTKLIFLSNPNNPTGRVLSEGELQRVAHLAERVGAWVLVDEVYAGLEWEGPRAPSIAALYPRGITTGSVSKALGLQGLRTGWTVCQDPNLIRDALILRENSSEIMNVMGEMIAEVALRPGRYETALSKARAEGQANLDKLEAFIAARPELSWVRPQAGLVGLCRVHSTVPIEEMAQAMLEPPYKTLVIPGSAFGEPNHIRLGVGGGPAANIEKGLERLAGFLDGLG